VWFLLTAQTKTGKTICLGNNYKKETLQYLRNVEEFLCPVCGEAVTLKLGNQRIFHFAHHKGTECRDFFESESVYHMDGKRQLYQWLLNQKIPAVLEYYDRDIGQRPDIMFLYKGKRFALEYQCSPIPEKIFMKRTETYETNKYTPLWILGNRNLHHKKSNIVSLSNFDYLFIRRTLNDSYYLPSFCPEKKQFQLLQSIHSYSIKNAFIKNSYYNPSYFTIEQLLFPSKNEQINIKQWFHELDYSFLQWSLHLRPEQQSFLKELYLQNLNPYLLPPEIGLPTESSFFIKTSPIIWQTYFYVDMIADKNSGDSFTLKEIERWLRNRIIRKEIIARNLPQFPERAPIAAVLHYVKRLAELGVIYQTGPECYQIKRCLQIPKTNREKDEYREIFFEKYLQKQYKLLNEKK
jgi:competence protein CoiA